MEMSREMSFITLTSTQGLEVQLLFLKFVLLSQSQIQINELDTISTQNVTLTFKKTPPKISSRVSGLTKKSFVKIISFNTKSILKIVFHVTHETFSLTVLQNHVQIFVRLSICKVITF